MSKTNYNLRHLMFRGILLFSLLFTVLTFPYGANAQTCTGSLGDAVINETFGAGTNSSGIGGPLPYGVTNLNYVDNACPDDGQYAIVSNSNGCFEGTWLSVGKDHTGDPDGYMMILNPNTSQSIFYIKKVNGDQLCPNTTYEFAAYILNILKDEPKTAGDIEPNITFTIETADGRPLTKPYNTRNIPAGKDVQWIQYGTYFTSPSDGSDIVVKLTNNSPGGAGNDFALDDITFKPCGPVIQTGFDTPGNTAAQVLCLGASGSYTLKAKVDYQNPSYQWQQNDNGNGWTDLPAETGPVLNFTLTDPPVGPYQFRVGVLNGSSTSPACRTYSLPLTVDVHPPPVVTIAPVTYICNGNVPLTLQASGGDSYSWGGPNGFTSTGPNPLVTSNPTAVNAGEYTVEVTAKGCPAFGSTTVKILPRAVAALSNNISICAGASTTLSAGQSLNATYYRWSPSTGLDHDDQATVIATPSKTTTYALTVGNEGCFDDAKTVTVTVLAPPKASAGENKIVFNGKSIKLDGTAEGDDISYYWTPAAGLDNPNSLTPNASPADSTKYTLHVVSNQNCGESTSAVFVRVFKQLVIPNTFTPNNDGLNDVWEIKALNTIPESTVKVFDRYGQAVYQSNGYARPWDGKRNNLPLPVGTYYYMINLKNNIPVISGWLLILR